MSEIEEETVEEEELETDDQGDGNDEPPDMKRALLGGDETDEQPPAPRSQNEIEQIQKKLEAEAVRHDKRVREIMGDDYAMLVPSPIDWTPGYIFNVEGMRPFPEQLAQLDALLGRNQAPDLLPAEDAQACDKCNAIGDVLTGSRKPGQETKPCSACGGSGWTNKLYVPPQQPQTYQFEPQTANAAAEPNQFRVADRWGRPFGHPHYNLDPAAVGV